MAKKGLKTDSKGRFVPGTRGGPGRGNVKKEEPVDFWDLTEQVILRDLRSSDPGIRQKALATYLKWRTLKDKADEALKAKSTLSQEMMEALGLGIAARSEDEAEVIDDLRED